MNNVAPQIGSVWYQTLYPDRLYIVIEHMTNTRAGKYGAILIQRVDTGRKSTEPWQHFIKHFSPLETMEIQ